MMSLVEISLAEMSLVELYNMYNKNILWILANHTFILEQY